MDPWYPMGSHDMLEVANMALHVAQMTGVDEIKSCFAAVTDNAAKTLKLENYGIAPGCHADLLVLQAADAIEAVRLKPARLFVIRRGKVLAETPPSIAHVTFGNTAHNIDFTRANIQGA